jgi:hypothetical protein
VRDERGAEINDTDWTGARFRRVRLSGARLRTIDLSAAVLRDVDLTGTSIDSADLDGLTINGIEVAPLLEAVQIRAEPVRALRRSSDPGDLREAWTQIEAAWERTYTQVVAQPSLAEGSVDEEWSLAETLRHLVFATDVWLGEALHNEPRYHPWGLPFTGYEKFVERGAESFGLDLTASPSYEDVLEVRKGRVANVRALLSGATPESLAAVVVPPPWMDGDAVTVLRCLWVILDEEIEHHRYAERDLALLAVAQAGLP